MFRSQKEMKVIKSGVEEGGLAQQVSAKEQWRDSQQGGSGRQTM